MLWRQTNVEIEIRKLSGAIKREIAGGESFVTRAQGPGRIAFSRDARGRMLPIHLAHGEGVDVREHQFVAATDNLDFSFERVNGVRNMLFGGTAD